MWKPRLLWIDSICINQKEENNIEKSQQLKLMGDVYRKAFLVTVCLQLPETPFHAAIEPIKATLRSWGVEVPEGALDEPMEKFEAFLAYDMLEELVFLDLRRLPFVQSRQQSLGPRSPHHALSN
jgi:Heterokaryon incompatibility protein (HET)